MDLLFQSPIGSIELNMVFDSINRPYARPAKEIALWERAAETVFSSMLFHVICHFRYRENRDKIKWINKEYRRFSAMEYGILGLCICFGALGYAEISKLKRQIEEVPRSRSLCCVEDGKSGAVTCVFSGITLKQDVRRLKQDGREAAAVRKIREAASMDLLEAKQYVDKL